MGLNDRSGAIRCEKLRIARRTQRSTATWAAADTRGRSMQCPPDQNIFAGAGEERIRRFDNWARDHAGFDLCIPFEVRREREMIHHPIDADDVFAVAIAGARKRRLGIGRNPVDLARGEARIRNRRAAGVNRQQPERLLWPSRDLGKTDSRDRGFSFALPHRKYSAS